MGIEGRQANVYQNPNVYGTFLLTPEEAKYLREASRGKFEPHEKLKGVHTITLDPNRVPAAIRERIQSAANENIDTTATDKVTEETRAEIKAIKITEFSAIKIDQGIDPHQHTTNRETYFTIETTPDGQVIIFDKDRNEIGRFDLDAMTYTIVPKGGWHGVEAKNGATFFGTKWEEEDREASDNKF